MLSITRTHVVSVTIDDVDVCLYSEWQWSLIRNIHIKITIIQKILINLHPAYILEKLSVSSKLLNLHTWVKVVLVNFFTWVKISLKFLRK